MNKEEYLKELSKHLKELPKKDYEDTMNYFQEYFDESQEDKHEDLIRELGNPSDVASEILSKLSVEKVEKEKTKFCDFSKNGILKIALIIILSIILSPLWLPLVIVFFVLSFIIFPIFIFLIFIFMIYGILASIKLIFLGISSIILYSLSGGFILIGCSLISLALSGMLFILSNILFKLFIRFCKMIKMFILRKRGKANE